MSSHFDSCGYTISLSLFRSGVIISFYPQYSWTFSPQDFNNNNTWRETRYTYSRLVNACIIIHASMNNITPRFFLPSPAHSIATDWRILYLPIYLYYIIECVCMRAFNEFFSVFPLKRRGGSCYITYYIMNILLSLPRGEGP